MPQRFFLYCVFLLCGAVWPVSGQTEYSFPSVSLEQGLSQPNVKALLSDERGFLWAGTVNGLNRFGNHSVRVYTRESEGASSLPDSRIEYLDEDREGRIWVLTRRGLARYRRDSDDFETLMDEPAWCAQMRSDGAWFGGDGCLYRMGYGPAAALERIPLFPTTEPRYRITAMTELPDSGLLLGTEDAGLYRFDPQEGKAVLFTSQLRHQPVALFAASDGYVYAAYFGDGFYRYDRDGTERGHFTTANSGLSHDYVQDFIEYDGGLWMATDGGGISILSLHDGSFRHLQQDRDNPDALPANSITLLHEDSFGNLWAGSVKRGFFQIRRNHIRSFRGLFSGLVEDAVSSLYRDDDGTLWVGTDGGGLHRFDPRTGQCIPQETTRGDKVLSIVGFGPDQLLLSLYTRGYFIFDKRSGKLRHFPVVNPETDHRMCFWGYLPRVVQVREDSYYFLSAEAWVYDARTKRFRPMPKAPDMGETDRIRLSWSDGDFSLLFRDQNVFFTEKDDSLRLLFSPGPDERISAVVSDGKQSVWVGSSQGLGRYDREKKSYERIRTSQFRTVTALAMDERDRLWICADNHLFTRLPGGRILSWSEADGFRDNFIKMIWMPSVDPDQLYFGGSEGLVQIDRNIPIPGEEGMEVFVDRIEVNGRALPNGAGQQHVRIKWNDESLSITVQARYHDMFKRLLFRFSVSDDARTNTIDTYEPQLRFPALPPGTYRISASCMTKSGVFSPPQEILTLEVLPPWYRTTWFHAAVLALTLLLLGAVYLWLSRRQERRSKDSMAGFLEGVLSATEPQEEPQPAPSAFRSRLDALIRDNLSNPELGVSLLCMELPMSRTRLYEKLREETGMGVNDYINRIRIERSVELLLGTNLTINEIAYEVGFAYPSYFSTSFKHVKGVTPTRFKRENTAPQEKKS